MDYTDVSEVAAALADETEIGTDRAERVAEDIAREANHDLGDPAALYNSVTAGSGLIVDADLELVSGVETPAVDSDFVALKSTEESTEETPAGEGGRGRVPVLLKEESAEERADKRVSYAPAMIPREPDKEGDVVGTATVESSAWEYLKQNGGVDTDHNLIDGKGEVVESWLLKEEQTYELPAGGTQTYEPGTWMLGIKWRAEPWDRIVAGDITGLSIYGTAEEIPLGKNLDDPEFSEGDPVRWSSQGVPVHGRVAGIHEQYSPNPDVTITGDEGEAVYSIYQWDDSLATPEFQISPSEPNIAKPQSSLSESQKDMPPATDDNFNRVSDSLGKALEVPAADVAQLLYPDRQTAAQVALRMGLGEPGEDPDTMTHPHTMDGAEMYMPGETHADFTEAVAGPEADTPQTLKQESTEQGDMGTDENEAGTDPDSGEGDRTLTAADVSAVADELREAGISAGGRGGDTDLGDMVAEKEIAPDTLLDVMAQAEAIDADAEELGEMLAPVMDVEADGMGGDEDMMEQGGGEDMDDDDDEEMKALHKGTHGSNAVAAARSEGADTGDPTRSRRSVLTED